MRASGASGDNCGAISAYRKKYDIRLFLMADFFAGGNGGAGTFAIIAIKRKKIIIAATYDNAVIIYQLLSSPRNIY